MGSLFTTKSVTDNVLFILGLYVELYGEYYLVEVSVTFLKRTREVALRSVKEDGTSKLLVLLLMGASCLYK